MNSDHTYVTATCNLDSPKAWWEKTVTKWIVWWTGQRFLRQVYFHIKAAARSVGLPVLSVFAEKLQNPTHLMSTCLGWGKPRRTVPFFFRSHSWWVSRDFGMWISSSLYNRYGSCSQPASKLDAEINLERPRKHPPSLWGLASFFPTLRVGQTPKATNHDSMEAASPEKMTENEGILLAVWRTPVPQLFVTWEWTGAMEKWSHDGWEWQTRWGFGALEISWS